MIHSLSVAMAFSLLAAFPEHRLAASLVSCTHSTDSQLASWLVSELWLLAYGLGQASGADLLLPVEVKHWVYGQGLTDLADPARADPLPATITSRGIARTSPL